MKIYFTASLRGKREFGEKYTKIVKCLQKLGYKMVSDHIFKNEFAVVASQDKNQALKSYQQLMNGIKKADIFVAEVSTQSLSVGHEITEAINLSKPVIVLYMGDRRPSMLFGSGYEKLQIIQYNDDNYQKLIEEAVEEAKKHTDVRFNFFVSPKILAYLDWVAKEKMIPRSVFLRNLIEKEMKKEKEFKD